MYHINTTLCKEHPVNIIRLHLNNFKIYDDGEKYGINVALLAKNSPVRDELKLLLHNLMLTYDIYHIETALRGLKMYKYCLKYLKVS